MASSLLRPTNQAHKQRPASVAMNVAWQRERRRTTVTTSLASLADRALHSEFDQGSSTVVDEFYDCAHRRCNRSSIGGAWPCGQNSQPKPDCHQRHRLVPRGGRRGLLVLSAGPLAYPYGATHRQVVASSLDSARVPFRGTNRGLEGFGKPDTGRG